MKSSTKANGNTRMFIVPVALILGMGAMHYTMAQQMVARNPSNPYQTNPRHHVRHVLLYNYALGGYSKTPLLNSMTRLANKYGFQLDVGGKSDYITPATLSGVDVSIFSDGDGDVLQNATSLAATRTFVEDSGKGLLQLHETAYIPCPTSGLENLTDPNCRWLARVLVRQYLGKDTYPKYARIYVDSTKVGAIPPHALAGTPAAAINHGKANPEFQGIFKGLPSNNGVVGGPNPNVWDSVGSDWFYYRGYVRQQGSQTFDGVAFGPVVCLMALDETAPYYTGVNQKMGDRVEVWSRHVGNGLTAYNNAGYDVYTRTRHVGGVTVNDSVEEKINWILIRYLARDFTGCMDSNYVEFNSEATVAMIIPGFDDPLPCKTLKNSVSVYKLVRGKAFPGIMVTPEGMFIPAPERGTYGVLVTNAVGKQLSSKTVSGGEGRQVEIRNLNRGVYYVEVRTPQLNVTVTRVAYRLD